MTSLQSRQSGKAKQSKPAQVETIVIIGLSGIIRIRVGVCLRLRQSGPGEGDKASGG
jgi:hypothetical protein